MDTWTKGDLVFATGDNHPQVGQFLKIRIMCGSNTSYRVFVDDVSLTALNSSSVWAGCRITDSNSLSNKWTHLAATFSSAEGLIRLYTNGVLGAEAAHDFGGTIPLAGLSLRQSFQPLNFGYNSPVGGYSTAGWLLDDVRVWTVARTAAEIQADMYLRLSGTESNLAGYWTFDNGTASDSTANGFDGTLNGGATIIPEPVPANPRIVAFSPSSGPIGTTVAITGTNFSPTPSDNCVFFGPARGTVTSASTTSLLVVVPAGTTLAPIKVTVGRRTATSAGFFNPTFQGSFNLTFAPKTSFSVGDSPRDIVVGDFNGDGIPDVATPNAFDGVTVLFGTGTGGFTSRTDLPAGFQPLTLAVADLNGDGVSDLAACEGQDASSQVSVWLGSPSRTFSSRRDFPVGNYPQSIVAADCNQDGWADLVTANLWDNTLSVLLGDGRGGFGTKRDVGTGPGALGIAAGDFNGDGTLDLASSCNSSAGGTVSILPGGGGGSFSQATNLEVGRFPWEVVVGDFDHDGKLDLAIANTGSDSVSVLLGSSAGLSWTRTDYPVGAVPHGIAVGDLNGDGNPDLVTANKDGNSVSVLLGDGTGGFGRRMDFPVGNGIIYSVAVGDFNLDGKPDIVTANAGDDTIAVFLNTTTARPPVITLLPQGQTVMAGASVTFCVGVSGLAPFTYQWRCNGGDLDGATNATLALFNVQPAHAGAYSVVVNNLDGSITTAPPAMLNVLVPPQNQAVYFGSNATLCVTCQGTQPLLYQWKFNGTDLVGTTNACLVLTNLQTPQTGAYQVVVSTSTGIVATSTVALTVVSFDPVKGAYNGLFYETSGVRNESSGFFTLSLTKLGFYSGGLQMAGGTYGVAGRFAVDGRATNTVLQGGTNPIAVEWFLDLNHNSTNCLTGRVIDGGGRWVAELLGDLAPVFGTNAASPYKGKYTLVIPGTHDPSITDEPTGDGYGTVKVDPTGVLTFSGALPVGPAITQRVPVSTNGIWPLYASLYGGKGVLVSWVHLNTNPEPAEAMRSERALWVRPVKTNALLYPNGFEIETSLVGSKYKGTSPVLPFSRGIVVFTGGALPTPLTNQVKLTATNTIINRGPQPLTMSITRTNGVFTGTIMLPGTATPIPFKGAILQSQTNGYGYFRNAGQSGWVLFGPAE